MEFVSVVVLERLVCNLGAMIRRLHNLVAWTERLFGPKLPATKPSTLIGIYLDQANQPIGARSRNAAAQERQDGKFAQNRNRPIR